MPSELHQDAFDATLAPLRAIRDLISACEMIFGADNGEQRLLERAQTGFAALRARFGDHRPNDAVAFEMPIEPAGPIAVHAAAAELLAAAEAAIAYDGAIQTAGNDPGKMASFCTAKGETLDSLYADWIEKSRRAHAKATNAAGTRADGRAS